jgi:hypothetical protein
MAFPQGYNTEPLPEALDGHEGRQKDRVSRSPAEYGCN